MGNAKKVEDVDLLHRLAGVFKDYGYEGASITILSQATGLQRPSLYHRFPRGKEQMAEEVLAFTAAWIETNLLEKLKQEDSPEDKIHFFAVQIGKIYNNGKDSCLLNILSKTKSEDNPFAVAIKATFKALHTALCEIARQAGMDHTEAHIRAEHVLIAIQGALVLSRGTASTAPFRRMQQRLPNILLASA